MSAEENVEDVLEEQPESEEAWTSLANSISYPPFSQNDPVMILFVFKVGHTVERKKKPLPQKTHHWRCYIEPWNPRFPLERFVQRVTFRLHETFDNPIQVIRQSPFAIEEDGFGNFQLYLEVAFFDCVAPFSYNLTLADKNSFFTYQYVKLEPQSDEWKKLVKYGGVSLSEDGFCLNAFTRGHSRWQIIVPKPANVTDINFVIRTIQASHNVSQLSPTSFFPRIGPPSVKECISRQSDHQASSRKLQPSPFPNEPSSSPSSLSPSISSSSSRLSSCSPVRPPPIASKSQHSRRSTATSQHDDRDSRGDLRHRQSGDADESDDTCNRQASHTNWSHLPPVASMSISPTSNDSSSLSPIESTDDQDPHHQTSRESVTAQPSPVKQQRIVLKLMRTDGGKRKVTVPSTASASTTGSHGNDSHQSQSPSLHAYSSSSCSPSLKHGSGGKSLKRSKHDDKHRRKDKYSAMRQVESGSSEKQAKRSSREGTDLSSSRESSSATSRSHHSASKYSGYRQDNTSISKHSRVSVSPMHSKHVERPHESSADRRLDKKRRHKKRRHHQPSLSASLDDDNSDDQSPHDSQHHRHHRTKSVTAKKHNHDRPASTIHDESYDEGEPRRQSPEAIAPLGEQGFDDDSHRYYDLFGDEGLEVVTTTTTLDRTNSDHHHPHDVPSTNNRRQSRVYTEDFDDDNESHHHDDDQLVQQQYGDAGSDFEPVDRQSSRRRSPLSSKSVLHRRQTSSSSSDRRDQKQSKRRSGDVLAAYNKSSSSLSSLDSCSEVVEKDTNPRHHQAVASNDHRPGKQRDGLPLDRQLVSDDRVAKGVDKIQPKITKRDPIQSDAKKRWSEKKKAATGTPVKPSIHSSYSSSSSVDDRRHRDGDACDKKKKAPSVRRFNDKAMLSTSDRPSSLVTDKTSTSPQLPNKTSDRHSIKTASDTGLNQSFKASSSGGHQSSSKKSAKSKPVHSSSSIQTKKHQSPDPIRDEASIKVDKQQRAHKNVSSSLSSTSSKQQRATTSSCQSPTSRLVVDKAGSVAKREHSLSSSSSSPTPPLSTVAPAPDGDGVQPHTYNEADLARLFARLTTVKSEQTACQIGHLLYPLLQSSSPDDGGSKPVSLAKQGPPVGVLTFDLRRLSIDCLNQLTQLVDQDDNAVMVANSNNNIVINDA